MSLELKLPDIGEGLTEAEIVSWLAKVGDPVAANQPIVEVETAKAVVEITAPRSGVLLHQGAAEGATLEVGQLLAVIGVEGETWGGASQMEAVATHRPETARSSSSPESVRAMPVVRRLAKELGVDLAAVTGTGPGGSVTRADVEREASQSRPASAAGRPLSATRRAIAAHLSRSWSEIPHVTVWGPADASRLLAAHRETGGPLEASLATALLPVLAEFPELNASFDGEVLYPSDAVHLGIAVAAEAGLVVPVVRNAASLDRSALAKEVERLIRAAMGRRLSPGDMTGATFTLSNVGAVGGGYGTPIIPQGTTAILSVGRAGDDVVVRNGEIAIAPVMPVSLSFDHRVVDGAVGSRFLNRFTEEVERFET